MDQALPRNETLE